MTHEWFPTLAVRNKNITPGIRFIPYLAGNALHITLSTANSIAHTNPTPRTFMNNTSNRKNVNLELVNVSFNTKQYKQSHSKLGYLVHLFKQSTVLPRLQIAYCKFSWYIQDTSQILWRSAPLLEWVSHFAGAAPAREIQQGRSLKKTENCKRRVKTDKEGRK